MTDLPTAPLVVLHTLVSLLAVATGLAAVGAMIRNRRADRGTAWFLGTTIFTSASGFVLPAPGFLPSHALGIVSLATLALCCYSRYGARMSGWWRVTYIVSAGAALYFNVFVLVTQLFLKVPSLHALAPTQGERTFAITHGVVLLVFVAVGIVALRRFRPQEAGFESGVFVPERA